MDWVAKIAGSAGVQLPPYKDLHLVADPIDFGKSLHNIGDGKMFDGGTVMANPLHSSLCSSTRNMASGPFDYSYSGLENAGHTDPASLASSIGIPYEHIDLGTATVKTGDPLALTVTNADSAKNLLSINWGEGSAFEDRSLTFSHVYTAGTYTANLLVIESGAFHSYDMTVIVSWSSSTMTGSANVSAYAPVNIPNQGLTTPTQPSFVVLKNTSIAALANGHISVSFLGVPNWTYTIQATNDLSQGFSPVASCTAAIDGTFQYEDASPEVKRFYRAICP